MLERANYSHSVREIVRGLFRFKRTPKNNFGITIFPIEIDIAKRKILMWSQNEVYDNIRRDNQKTYLLGVQCFEILIQLLAVDDPIIKEFGIDEHELRESLVNGVDFKTTNIVNKVASIMKRNPRNYKRRIRNLANQFGSLQSLKQGLLATSSNLNRS